jgi:hypothetical protein
MGRSLVGVILGLLAGATAGFAAGELPGFRERQVQALSFVLGAGFGAVTGAIVGLAAARPGAPPIRPHTWVALAVVGLLWACAIGAWVRSR